MAHHQVFRTGYMAVMHAGRSSELQTRIDDDRFIAKAGMPQLFGFARPLVREPGLPARWKEGRGAPEAACISCNRCIRGFAKGMFTRCRVTDLSL